MAIVSSLLACLGLKVTPTAVQQLRELLACHVEQNFNTHVHAPMPEVTKFQLLEQLRCFDEVAHPNYWGDANCLLVFTSCYGHGVVVLSADGDTCHWAFAAESPKCSLSPSVLPSHTMKQLLKPHQPRIDT